MINTPQNKSLSDYSNSPVQQNFKFTHVSTEYVEQVVKNMKAKQFAREQKLKEYDEMQELRKTLKVKIEKKGMDIAKMFQMFDTDGSGSFS